MSSVRKCDVSRSRNCFGIFSELEEGWQTFRGSTVKTNALTGEQEAVTTAMDACPACAVQSTVKESVLERLARRLDSMPDDQVARLLGGGNEIAPDADGGDPNA